MNQMVLRPQNFSELVQFAQMAAKSAMVPKAYSGKPEDICLAIQMGSEVGLAPMQALQNIAVIGGRPSVFGDAMLGLVRASGLLEDFSEKYSGEGQTRKAICRSKRVGDKEAIERTFSVADAKLAGLWGKAGPWTQYPDRMLQMRARGFALRDSHPDVLKGLISAEEAADIAAAKETFNGPTLDATPEPAPPASAATDVPRKKTVSDFLDDIQAALYQAMTADEVDAVIARDDVQAALDRLKEHHKAMLQEMIRLAIERTAAPPPAEAASDDDDDWPGPK